jgi:hypothetical protein
MQRELGDVADFDFKGKLGDAVTNFAMHNPNEAGMSRDIDAILLRLAGTSPEHTEGRAQLIGELLSRYCNEVEMQKAHIAGVKSDRNHDHDDIAIADRELTALQYIVRELYKISLLHPAPQNAEPNGGFDFGQVATKASVEKINDGLRLSAKKSASTLMSGDVAGFDLAIVAMRY